MMKKIFLLFVFGSIILGCSSSDSSDDTPPTPPTTSFQRSELLINWADNIIIPSYEAFQTSLSSLQTAFDNFNTTADEANLIALRNAWRDAYFAWQRVSMFEIGPAENVDYRLNINIYPADVTQIQQNITSGNADLSLPSNRDAKGFPALDYLINGLAADDTAIVARFNDGAAGINLLNYTGSLIADMVTLTNGVLQEWTGNFRDSFVANDGSSATASVDRYVNDYILYYERFLRAGKVGIPAGVFSASLNPQNLEAFYKGDISNQLCLEALDAVQDFFNGISFNSTTNGIGLDDYLNTLGVESGGQQLSSLINNQYNTARNMINGLDSFQEELQNSPPVQLLLAYDELQRIVPLIKVDMLSALNINVDFQDADGD
ncbi:peptidase M75 [Flavobacteriaceae bacterium R38]|nr:peptidase M75 [Flavobacteriaceae bacterium R38]